MDDVRSFIAIELPDPVRQLLAGTQAAIKKMLVRAGAGQPVTAAAKWVDPQGVHLTLKFLGAVPESQIATIETAIERATAGIKPFSLAISGLGSFPGWSRPRVLWVGVDVGESTALAELQVAVEEEMARLGFAKENRPFKPHLTLARVRETTVPEDRRTLGEVARAAPALKGVSFTVDEVSLMRSDLSPRGARYTRLAAFRLG